MRANEFLTEVEMTPNALRREASKIDARAGMEFEMYVPNAAPDDEDAESEADYEQDERANDIDDIIQFFDDGDVNSRRELASLRDDLTEAYDEYRMNEEDEQWQNEGKASLKDYIEEKEFDMDEAIDQAMNDLGFTAAEKNEAKEAGESANGIMTSKELPDTPAYRAWVEAVTLAERSLEEKVEEEWHSQGRTYDTVRDDWLEEQEAPDQRDWLRSEGYYNMSHIEDNFNITWPHWIRPNSGGDFDIETVGASFSKALGKQVMTGGYHRAGRSDTAYSLEPDGSLDDPEESEDGGLEFISPPMPIADLLDDLKKVKQWANHNGCYTNESTGLHINVSVPQGASRDYVKLALLLGDDYVLKNFGREANSFCRSSLAQVKQYANNEANARAVLEKMRSGLDAMASRAIHTGETNKYVSINNKGNYVEFRSPGGDWLSENFDKVETTLLRAVVALDAASDPQKYRKEYLKKLYKILAPKGEGDPMAIFAKYAAGEFKEMPKETLKFLIGQLQQQRVAKKNPNGKNWYEVSMNSGHSIEVVATDIPSAIAAAESHWGIRPGDAGPLRAEVIRPYEDFPQALARSLGHTGDREPEATPDIQRPSTNDQLSAAYDQAFPPSEAPNTTGPGDYVLVDSSNDDYIRVFPRMANRQAAHDAAVLWLDNNDDQFDPAQRRYFQLRRS